ncbi:TraR/DksA C4-type zinc finger protein [Salinisphaera orenii]|uniref:TraR/DksA C4-type zinc finger protein n=1 Tax=Salinisphaera orenii TaxID=856731 RepID=UPI000DBE46FA
MADIVDRSQPESDQLVDYGLSVHAARRADESARPVNWRGTCAACDEPIAGARLAADPRAERCADCQTIREQRARHWTR